MEVLLKKFFPANLYLKWFNPKEDNTKGVNVYLHIKDTINNSTFTLKFKPGVSRYDVVAFLKQIHDLPHQARNNSHDNLSEIFGNTNETNEINEINNTPNGNNTDNTLETNEVLRQELSCLFNFYSVDEINTALDKLKIFTKSKYIFFGESVISVTHEQDEDNKLWYTQFIKTCNFGKREETECIACICNKLSFVFDDTI